MIQRRHVRMIQPRFVPMVQAGTKPHTIRKIPQRKIRVGDLLDLRMWEGKPYRSKQRKIREVICTKVTPIEIRAARGDLFMRLGKALLYVTRADALARADGFRDAMEMITWFELTHGLPFKGILIEWQP